MNVHKVTIMVIDHDGLGADEVCGVIENARYPNRCIHPYPMAVESVDIGEWRDQHPLNMHGQSEAEFARLFPGGVDRLRAGLREALDAWEMYDLDRGVCEFPGHKQRIADLRKLVGP